MEPNRKVNAPCVVHTTYTSSHADNRLSPTNRKIQDIAQLLSRELDPPKPLSPSRFVVQTIQSWFAPIMHYFKMIFHSKYRQDSNSQNKRFEGIEKDIKKESELLRDPKCISKHLKEIVTRIENHIISLVDLAKTANDPSLRYQADTLLRECKRSLAKAYSNAGLEQQEGLNGVQKKPEAALEFYTKAAELGDPDAQYNLAVIYHKQWQKDPKEVAELYEKAAKQGHPDAQFKIAKRHEKGNGVPKDLKKAAFWYEKAAKQGQVRAQYELGRALAIGDGIKKNLKEAVKWFKKAGGQGQNHPIAQFNLGMMYAHGHGVKKNYGKALEWLRKAQTNENRGEEFGSVRRDAHKWIETVNVWIRDDASRKGILMI